MVTKQEEFEAFLEQQKPITYKLGGITGTPEGDMLKYTELKIAAQQEAKKKEDFYKAREEAFSTLNTKHQEESQTLANTWQEYENNNLTIPQ